MGVPFTDAWARKFQLQIPYVDARKWGTGVNPVHSIYGGPGRGADSKLNANQLDGRTPPEFVASEDFISYGPDYGYQCEDIAGLDVAQDPSWAVHGVGKGNDDAWPEWSLQRNDTYGTYNDPPTGGAPGPKDPNVEITRANIPSWASRPWQFVNKTALRSIRAGEFERDSPGPRGVSSLTPTESVNEGWINKASSGGLDPWEGELPDDNVMPSATAQYERNTSMQQRKLTLNNDRATLRGTDDARTAIPSRLVPMKIRYFSGQDPFIPGQEETYRSYDMFPYQIDDIPRPFTYRTAGTGPQRYLETNEQWLRTPLQRQPPPDPSMGQPESQLSDIAQYGYSSEDQGFY